MLNEDMPHRKQAALLILERGYGNIFRMLSIASNASF
jgi:hypothetical protein